MIFYISICACVQISIGPGCYYNTNTVDTGYKNTVGSREECSYIRYVLITGTFSMGKDRNGSHTIVLITDIYCTYLW